MAQYKLARYKLTLTNEQGEVLDHWDVMTDQTYTDDGEDSSCNIDKSLASDDLIEDIARAIDMSDRADKDAANEKEAPDPLRDCGGPDYHAQVEEE